MTRPDRDVALETAALARLNVDDDERERLCDDFAHILDAFRGLAALDPGDVAPTQRAARMPSALREDEPRPSLPTDLVLRNAPARDGEFFGVPKTLGGD